VGFANVEAGNSMCGLAPNETSTHKRSRAIGLSHGLVSLSCCKPRIADDYPLDVVKWVFPDVLDVVCLGGEDGSAVGAPVGWYADGWVHAPASGYALS